MIKIRDFSKGLHIGVPEDEVPQGALVRSRGIHPISQNSVRSRFGGSLLHSLNAHSIFRYKDAWYYGVSTSFYAGAAAIKASLGGSRLSAAKMGPTAGVDDRLFIAGGDELFKVDVSTSIVNDNYKWTESGNGTNEYYLTDIAGNDPGLLEPDALLVDNEAATAGTVGSLAAGEWDWGDNDTLGYDTIYIRLSDGTDPDTQADDYIKVLYVQDWGITPPNNTVAAADGGAGGNLEDGAIYEYRFTYYSSKTGTRSNPTVASSGPYTKLLLHCEGADASTTFTDNGINTHTVTANGDAQIDDAQKKFGSTSGLFDGTGDYLTVPSHVDWVMGSGLFTIDFWVRFAAQTGDDYFFSYTNNDISNRVILLYSSGSGELIFEIRIGGVVHGQFSTTGGTLATDTWYHIALVRGWANEIHHWAIIVDGVKKGGYSANIVWPNFSAPFSIGRQNIGGAESYFNGWIDEFRVSKGIARWIETFTPPVYAYGSAIVDLSGGSTSIDLSNIPESDDPQVDQVELWRTQGGGSAYFLLTRIANGTTTYTDNADDDDLYALELPVDNYKPYAWFDDCYGPHNASMFWITRTQVGEKGRLYYSSIGRAENVEGYIEVTSDADPLQKIIGWRGYLGVISQSGIYQVLGTNPYQAKSVAGVPGTNNPHTAVVTPIGLVYEANDGVRVFDGSTSRLLNFDAVSKLFRGISAGDLTSFNGIVATYARGEYFISDASQTLAIRLEDLRWRDVGIGCNALAYAEDDDILVASISSTVLDFEKEGTTQDNATDISLIIEPGHVRLSEDKKVMLQNVHVDANANSETLSVYLVIDGLTVVEALAIVNRITQTLGSNTVTNGTFDADTNWTKGTGWSIAAGVASCDGSQVAASNLYQDVGAVTYNFYELTYTVTISAGNIKAYFGNGTLGIVVTSSGTYTEINQQMGASDSNIYLQASDDFVGTVDSVIYKQVTNVSFSNGSLSILLGTIDDAYRIVNTFPVGLLARIAGIRITGSLDAAIEIFGIDIEV